MRRSQPVNLVYKSLYWFYMLDLSRDLGVYRFKHGPVKLRKGDKFELFLHGPHDMAHGVLRMTIDTNRQIINGAIGAADLPPLMLLVIRRGKLFWYDFALEPVRKLAETEPHVRAPVAKILTVPKPVAPVVDVPAPPARTPETIKDRLERVAALVSAYDLHARKTGC